MKNRKSPASSALLASYLSLTVALSLVNRWALGFSGFRFPLLLTAFQALSSSFFAIPSLLASNTNAGKRCATALKTEWQSIFSAALISAAAGAFANISLQHLPLSIYQTIRTALPLITAIQFAVTDRQLPGPQEGLALILLTLGITLFTGDTYYSGPDNTKGIMLCLMSIFATAVAVSATSELIEDNRVDPGILNFFIPPITCAFLFPVALIFEGPEAVHFLAEQPGVGIRLLGGGAALAGAHTAVHNRLPSLSPLTSCILDQLKMVLIIGISAYYLDDGREWTQRMSFGSAIAFLGFAMHSWAQAAVAANSGHKTPSRGKRKTSATPKRGRRTYNEADTTAVTPPATLPGLKTPTSKVIPGLLKSTPRTESYTTTMSSRRRWRTPASLV